MLWGLHDEYEPLCKEYSDVKVPGLWTTGPGDLWLEQGAASTATDIQRLTLRTLRLPGPGQAAVISALGATPVNMTAPCPKSASD